MRRRSLLGALGGAAVGGLAGCLGGFETRAAGEPPLSEDRPDAVYVPTHVEGMEMVGRQSSGAYECALTYTYPHRFWLMTGTRREKVEVTSDDSVHLMPVVWEAETGIVPPDVNPQVSITRDGESVAGLAPWPMLSQPMGFHFGDNVVLDGEGTYRVEVQIGAPSTRRTGSLADNEGGASFAFDFTFQQSTLTEITSRTFPADEVGTRGAAEPMGTEMMPDTRAPTESEIPGTVVGTGTSGDARFVVTALSDATPFGGGADETYLAVSPRTPHNRYVLPLMALSGTLTRAGETVYGGPLQATIDPALRHHYGAVVPSVESGDELTITVDSPPQMARHEGYETAFIEMGEMTLAL